MCSNYIYSKLNKFTCEGTIPLLTLAVFVSVLEGLHQAQSLVHGATNRQVIDGDLPQNALVVNHKQTSGGAQGERF